uniref:Protein kinase domain-containing protein n=1 Tax=Panagrolaimus davidi TaxID=227884 RepID=A0A914PW72_9BILA
MNILDAYTPDTTFQSFQNIYLVFELMDQRDLRHFHFHNWNKICHHQNGAPLIADIMLQLFSAIAYLHQPKLRLIHRDIKPDNIFIKQAGEGDCIVKLGDLGHARQIPPKEGQPMTMNITTCQYRAPEVMKNELYSMPIDIWSAGCVLAEILVPPNLQKPLDNALFNSDDPKIVSQMHCQLTAQTITTKFTNNRLPQWKNVEKWGEYFRYILENTLKLDPSERLKAAKIIELNPFEMLDMEKYKFQPVTDVYEEKAENFRVDWRMKIYDKLKDFNQKRMEEIQRRQNENNLQN